MSKFKVGDTVKVVNSSQEEFFKKGAVGNVVDFDKTGVSVDFYEGDFYTHNNGSSTWWADEDELELVGKDEEQLPFDDYKDECECVQLDYKAEYERLVEELYNKDTIIEALLFTLQNKI